VFSVREDILYLRALQERIEVTHKAVILGGGFIGIEFADELKKAGVEDVTVVECAEHCLGLAYDQEFCTAMEEHLRQRGVRLETGRRLVAVEGNGVVEGVTLDDGTLIPADLVLVGIGASPNTDLASVAGLKLGPTGAIAVDRTLRTSAPDIFAAGDCAEKTSYFGGEPSSLKLASIACGEGRVAGANLFQSRRQIPGTLGAWCTAVGELALGTAGLTETAARAKGIDVVAVSSQGINRHPAGMPGAGKLEVKMVFDRRTGRVLGGQVMGDHATGEIANVIAACIQGGMSAEDLSLFQLGTHPALTASPLVYALNNLAEMALVEMERPR